MSEGTDTAAAASPAPPRDGSHGNWLGWTLALLAVPVVYLLSVPPLYCGVVTNWGKRYPTPPPAWLAGYKQPFQWTYDHTPLQVPLDSYTLWWRMKFLRHVPTVPAGMSKTGPHP